MRSTSGGRCAAAAGGAAACAALLLLLALDPLELGIGVGGVGAAAGPLGGGAAAVEEGSGAAGGRRLKRSELVHVCLCSDDSDLRAAVVAFQSAYQATVHPERLRFHLVTPPELAKLFSALLREHVPELPVKVHTNASLYAKLRALAIEHPAASDKRASRPSVYAPFYLEQLLRRHLRQIRRVILLDTNTVVLGDLLDLHHVALQGHPIAAVRTCSRPWLAELNFQELAGVGAQLSPKACTLSLGVLVLDLVRLQELEVAAKLETWIGRHHKSKDGLWSGAPSQAGWLLTVGMDVADLHSTWACGGLSRNVMSVDESIEVRRSGFDKKALKTLGLQIDELGNISPFLATCSGSAKLLQYDGPMVPWMADRFSGTLPVCVLPASRRGMRALPQASKQVRVFCEKVTFVNCTDLWSAYLPEKVACALKDFDKEWQEMEDVWASRKRDRDWRLDAADLDEANQEAEESMRRHRAVLDDELERLEKEARHQRRHSKKDKERRMRLKRQRAAAAAAAAAAAPAQAARKADSAGSLAAAVVVEMSFEDFESPSGGEVGDGG